MENWKNQTPRNAFDREFRRSAGFPRPPVTRSLLSPFSCYCNTQHTHASVISAAALCKRTPLPYFTVPYNPKKGIRIPRFHLQAPLVNQISDEVDAGDLDAHGRYILHSWPSGT
jgi:hypothetical protein